MLHFKSSAFLILAFVTVIVGASADVAVAQKRDPSTALVNAVFHECLQKEFPDIGLQQVSDRKDITAFDSKSGRNFAWDKDKGAWIDTKTLEAICPRKGGPPHTALVNILFHGCLQKIFPDIGLQQVSDRKDITAFDGKSGRNFAWDRDKGAWIDTKTLKAVCPVVEETPRTQRVERPSKKPAKRAKRPTSEERTTGAPGIGINIGIGFSGGGERDRDRDRERGSPGFGAGIGGAKR